MENFKQTLATFTIAAALFIVSSFLFGCATSDAERLRREQVDRYYNQAGMWELVDTQTEEAIDRYCQKGVLGKEVCGR